MRDSYGRTIDYMRISVTDRCNLRCQYCMPEGIDCISHEEILRYEEFLRLCRIFVQCGIVHYKVTGGEPLVRRGAADFIKNLKEIPGVETVTLTTNGILLEQEAQKLAEAKVDAVNISLDAAECGMYEKIAGRPMYEQAVKGISSCLDAGIRTKINCVLLKDSKDQIRALARYAKDYPIDVRFIELMPIGVGQMGGGLDPDEAREELLKDYPDLHPVNEKRGYGPACYEASGKLKGRIGWISAVSHKFCGSCNRVRLTSTGMLKPCLCYGESIDFRALLRAGADDRTIKEAFEEAVKGKPMEHCFSDIGNITEHEGMSRIGG